MGSSAPDAFESGLIRGPAPARLRGERLSLGPWDDADRAPFAALNADPQTMRFFPSTLTRAQSDAMVDTLSAAITRRGWGFWAARLHEGGFAGFIGLNIPRFEAPFLPAVEIGWRLARPLWGRGLATEGARLALAYAFGTLGLDEVVSFTVVANEPSRRVMERLGMRHDPDHDFDHPGLPQGHPLRRHVLYRLRGDDPAAVAYRLH